MKRITRYWKSFKGMLLLKKIKGRIKKLLSTKNAVDAYNLLAPIYDKQDGNLLMDLDGVLLEEILAKTNLGGKVVLDIGCGTGRHWRKLSAQGPEKIIGADSSTKMLEILAEKFPGAETHIAKGSIIDGVNDQSADLIISTLTIGYIKNLKECLSEWNRVLKSSGEVIVTDYHPALLQLGGGRTFEYNKKTIDVRNYIHPVEELKRTAAELNWRELNFTEKKIDESVKSYYASKNSLETYEKYKGTPLIYALHFRKT